MNKVSKISLSVITAVTVFGLSAFGMYKYNEFKVFDNLVSQGKQYMIQKDYDKSIQVFKQALTYKNNADIQANIALAQNLKNEDSKKGIISKNIQLANEAAKNNKYDEANKYLDEILKVDSNNADAKNLKSIFEKAVKDQQEKVKAEEEKTNIQNQQSSKNADSQAGTSQQKAYQTVCNKFKDYDVSEANRSVYSNEIANQAGDRYYLFYLEYKSDHSATDSLIGVDKKTGVMYKISGYTPIERIS